MQDTAVMDGSATAQDDNGWGPRLGPEGSAAFRLWAPAEDRMSLRLDGRDHAMRREVDGWHRIAVPDAAPGTPYAFILGDGTAVPDPAARAQQGDVHGPSLLTDPEAYAWRSDWRGRPWEEAVIYELHIGTFTEAGTFRAAIDRLDHLARTGITAVEIMPVAHFGGTRGWGYDGVLLYAPHSAYGTPDDLKALVDACHARGMMVLLDVVFNHFGPDGNYLHRYAPDFFHPEIDTPWGGAIAYDLPPVRRFIIDNALYWLTEFRFDGLRLDAIDHIHDPSDPEILIEIAQEIRAKITDRPVHLTTEDNRNVTFLHERGKDGTVPLHTAEWNDDFHNVAHAIATHEAEGYYIDFAHDRWELLARCLAEGFAYQGQRSAQKEAARGQPSAHLPPTAFVNFLQNHDQTGNRAFGERLCALTDAPMLEALTAILLLSPHIPLLFMGEEYGEERPFCFFVDFEGDLAQAVTEGRRSEFAAFDGFAATGLHHVPDPVAPSTFAASKLNWAHADTADGGATLERTRRLLALRRDHVVPHLAGTGGNCGTVLSHADGVIAVDWASNGATLRLRANLSDEVRPMVPAAGRLIYGPDGGTGGTGIDPDGAKIGAAGGGTFGAAGGASGGAPGGRTGVDAADGRPHSAYFYIDKDTDA